MDEWVINKEEVGEFALGVLLLVWDRGGRGPPWETGAVDGREGKIVLGGQGDHPHSPLLWNQILSLWGRWLNRKSHEGRAADHMEGSGGEWRGVAGSMGPLASFQEEWITVLALSAQTMTLQPF